MVKSLQEFYADSHMGTRFGVRDKLHPNGHSGQDYNGWARGTDIPNLYAGTVVRTERLNPNFGNVVTVRDDVSGIYYYYCHMNDLVVYVDQKLNRGESVGPIGSTGYSKGNHLHLGVSTVSSNPNAYSGLKDPVPYVQAAKSGGGGGGGITPIKKEVRMRETQLYRAIGKNDWSRIGADVLPVGNFPGGYEATSDVNVARVWGEQIAGTGSPSVELAWDAYIARQAWGNTEYRSHRADDIARAREALVGHGGGSGQDTGAIVDAVEARLQDDFAKVNSNVDDQPTEFEITPK